MKTGHRCVDLSFKLYKVRFHDFLKQHHKQDTKDSNMSPWETFHIPTIALYKTEFFGNSRDLTFVDLTSSMLSTATSEGGHCTLYNLRLQPYFPLQSSTFLGWPAVLKKFIRSGKLVDLCPVIGAA